jgi:hypothetical protein
MQIQDYSTLYVGQVVHVYYNGRHQGSSYRVVKVNKVKVTLERESDKHIRTFSVKRRFELDGFSQPFRTAYLVYEYAHHVAEAEQAARNKCNDIWASIGRAVERKDPNLIKDLLLQLG